MVLRFIEEEEAHRFRRCLLCGVTYRRTKLLGFIDSSGERSEGMALVVSREFINGTRYFRHLLGSFLYWNDILIWKMVS